MVDAEMQETLDFSFKNCIHSQLFYVALLDGYCMYPCIDTFLVNLPSGFSVMQFN